MLKIESALSGAAGETHLKIGFHEAPGGRRRHPAPPLELTGEKYKEELASVKKALAVVEKPADALAAKDQSDRYFAAAILLGKYGTAPAKVEPNSADETQKRIEALHEADWTKAQLVGVPAPATLVWQRQLGPDDGGNPKPFKGPGEVAVHFKAQLEKWFADRGEKFRMKNSVEKK